MSVFIRRFTFDPGNDVLLNIESVNVLDLAPPASIAGVGTGNALIVGEFENGPYAMPTQVTSTTDLTNSFGSIGFTYGGVPGNYPCAVSRLADGALAPEFWNGNGSMQLNGKQFAQLTICRVDTSVGAVQLTPYAYVTSGLPAFRYLLTAGQVLGLDIGSGPATATFNATAATVTSGAGTYSYAGGETLTLGYDGAPNFTVTFLSTDGSQASTIARINQYAGFAFAATVTGTTFSLTGTAKGLNAQVRVVSGSAGVLTALGLTAATTFGTGNVNNIAAVTPAEIKAVVEAGISGTQVEVDQNGALRISNKSGTATSFIQVTSATTATNLGFVSGQLGTYLGVAAVVSGVVTVATPGTIQMVIDGVNNNQAFTVTLIGSESVAQTVTAINTGAGKTVCVIDGASRIAIFGSAPGGYVNILGASAAGVLSQLNLLVSNNPGVPLPFGVIPAGTVVQNAALTRIFVTTQDVAFGPAGVTIGGFTVTTLGPWTVKVRHALDDGSGLSATAGTVIQMPTPAALMSLGVTNPQVITAALTESAIDAAYVNALASTLDINSVAKKVNVIWSARQSNTVRRTLKTNVLTASGSGCYGRVACVRPPLGTLKTVATSTNADPGVGAYRSDRVIYTYPGANTFVPVVGTRGTAGGVGFTATGNVDIGADGFMASILSQLPPEENPGQETPFTGGIVDLETSPNMNGWTMGDYIIFKAAGIAALRFDDGNAIFQSGVTSVDPLVFPGLVHIARRRMADFIQDSLSTALKAFGKKLSTNARRKAIESEVRAFMKGLLGDENSQRIDSFGLSTKSNTPQTLGMGLYRLKLQVRTLSSLDSIVLETTIGEQVTITEQPQSAAA